MLTKLEGASSDRPAVSGMSKETLTLVDVLGHDLGVIRSEDLDEDRRRLGELEDDGIGIWGLDAVDVRPQDGTRRMVLAKDLLDGEFHVGRGEGSSVVPGHVPLQLEGIRAAVFRDRPGLGEPRLGLEVSVVSQKRVVHGTGGDQIRVVRRCGGQRLNGAAERDVEHAPALGCRPRHSYQAYQAYQA